MLRAGGRRYPLGVWGGGLVINDSVAEGDGVWILKRQGPGLTINPASRGTTRWPQITQNGRYGHCRIWALNVSDRGRLQGWVFTPALVFRKSASSSKDDFLDVRCENSFSKIGGFL